MITQSREEPNILVDDNLNVYLIDFGFAKIGEGEATALSSIALGTPGFISPEQVNNLPLTEATDLYGLGATLIGLLCKIQSKDFVDIVDYNFQIDFKTRVFHLAFSFIEWLDKLVRLNPDQRFSSAQEALNALLPLELIRIPELHLSQSSFTCEAKCLGEKIIQSIEFNNPIPETVLEGSILSYQQKESRRHDWLTIFYPKSKRFKGNQISCTFEIDTGKLTANKVYQRTIIFESNARQNNTPFNISIKTAPLPKPILPPYLLLAGIYLIFTIGSGFVWIQDNLILQLSITILAALAVLGMDSILILIGTMAIMYLGAIVGTMMAFLPDFIISLATSLDIIRINIAMPMNRHGYLFPTSASLGLLFGICHAFVLVGNTNNPNSKNEKKIIDETSFVYIAIWLVYLAVTFTFILPYFIGNTFLPMPVLHWVSFGLLDLLFITIFKIFWGYLFGAFFYLPLSLNRHIFYMFLSKRLRFFLLPMVNLSFAKKGYTNKIVILLYLYLTIGLAIASGIGSQVGWHNVYILTTLLITGILLLILLLFPPIYYGRIITKYSKNIY
ncbi:hypothetical protein IQ232_12965 [Microcystis aeruginosa LEGE 11464]|uniref:protein kinase domain-containing protein n=1 Tax=Microcystis sp. M049S2 TaxID=2771169 RepID=UPI001881432A|nr:hypothetical protein [Microcystis aeruginosa LEGE 11464]MCA2657723.1 hypothetical protein [Microcystis sp. M049S2]